MQNPQPNCTRWSQTFRDRFRLPYESYLTLLSMLVDEDDKGPQICCIWSKQAIYEVRKNVNIVGGNLRECEHAYRIAGFPGCIGSTDATHIALEKISFKIRQSHLGFKTAATTRTYNLTVNHKRQILHTTTGHPGRWNNKTLARFDHFLDELRKGGFDEQITFDLLDKSGEKTVCMKGAYVIVDNGYLEWSSTIPPFKNSSSRSEIRFSQWLESLHKDVECTFGILKNRWRILKTGIPMHNTEVADNVWLTCCALHNMLLNVDGLSTGWQDGVPSYRQVEANGQFDLSDMPRAIQRLSSPSEVRDFQTMDRSSCGRGRPHADDRGVEEEEVVVNDNDHNQIGNDRSSRVVSVTELSHREFRGILVDNFNILYHQGRVSWPKRLPVAPRNVPTY